jgi:hypothetical protein
MTYKTQIYRFWTEYRPDIADQAKLVGIDWVEYGPPGMGDRQRAVEKVSRIGSVRPRDPHGMNKALAEANDLWDYIRPAYEAWKNGQELPDKGTPLAAWNALSREQADIFKARGIKTVEAIAELTEAGLQQIPLPSIRKTVAAAKLFLQAYDQTRVAGELALRDAEIQKLKVQMAEMMASLKADDKTGELVPLDAAPRKRRRGRPPKRRAQPPAAQPEDAAA